MTNTVRRQPRRKVTELPVVMPPQKWGRIISLLVLWSISIGSALGVVSSTYSARSLTENLEGLRREDSHLRVVAGQLQLERSSWAAYSRIEKIASDDLAMSLPKSDETILIVRP